MLNNYDKAYMI